MDRLRWKTAPATVLMLSGICVVKYSMTATAANASVKPDKTNCGKSMATLIGKVKEPSLKAECRRLPSPIPADNMHNMGTKMPMAILCCNVNLSPFPKIFALEDSKLRVKSLMPFLTNLVEPQNVLLICLFELLGGFQKYYVGP